MCSVEVLKHLQNIQFEALQYQRYNLGSVSRYVACYRYMYVYTCITSGEKHVGFERQYIISRCHWRMIIGNIWYVWNIWLDFFRSTFKMFYAFEVSKKQHCFDCFAIWLSSAVLCECLSCMNEKQDYLFVLLIYLNVYKSYLIILYW